MISEGMLDVLARQEVKRIERLKVYNELILTYDEKQYIVAIEELSELQKELCKDLRGKGKRENIIEEIADVTIMLEQLCLIYNIEDYEIDEMIDKKIERTKGIL